MTSDLSNVVPIHKNIKDFCERNLLNLIKHEINNTLSIIILANGNRAIIKQQTLRVRNFFSLLQIIIDENNTTTVNKECHSFELIINSISSYYANMTHLHNTTSIREYITEIISLKDSDADR